MSMTLEKALELGFRAGFIRACNWTAPVSQDVDSPAFAKELAQFIEAHTPITQPAQSVDGMVFVPVEPTMRMEDAGANALRSGRVTMFKRCKVNRIYHAMLTAALQEKAG